jgi:multidrug efflux pump subunit AcrA (membrane-fusion protein)
LSPAVIISSAPEMIRSPLNGVVKAFSVAPNHSVRQGENLLRLEDTELRSRLDVARKAFEIAREEYLQVSQQAIVEDRAKSRIAILEARMEQQRLEVEYVNSLLQRVVLTSPIDGVAIFDDPNDWIGRPVIVGETIMQISHPDDIELEIHVPAEDAINLESGADVLFFLNTSPAEPVPAKIRFASYHAGLQSDGYLAYRVEAEFSEKDPRLRIGLRGTAKIYGESKPLALLLLRKPINVVRQWLGL